VVALDGRIVLGDESNALRVKLKSLIAEGKEANRPEYGQHQVYRQRGLGILVAAHCSAKTQGASLRLCHLGSKFQKSCNHQTADGIRGLRYGSSRCRQSLKLSAISAPERMDKVGTGTRASLVNRPRFALPPALPNCKRTERRLES